LAIGFDGLGILCAIGLILSWRARIRATERAENQKEAVEEVSESI